ncbi:MAG TPA: Rieske (2Fe-2S) protein, partial [Dongiaceae bacterium]|nr:Rieske (2Fe-2S) protein [Dongiaceae bacterium]
MSKSLDALLDILAEYPGLADTACLSLPREAYTSPELHALEVKTIFEKSWLCVGRAEYVPNAGDYYTIDVIGEPVIIVRGKDGEVRALNAACRHRAMPVAQGKGNTGRFTCPYHAWTYALDGRLIGAPHMEQSQVFNKEACRLPSYRLESWMGFLFVNLDDDAAPLQPVM